MVYIRKFIIWFSSVIWMIFYRYSYKPFFLDCHHVNYLSLFGDCFLVIHLNCEYFLYQYHWIGRIVYLLVVLCFFNLFDIEWTTCLCRSKLVYDHQCHNIVCHTYHVRLPTCFFLLVWNFHSINWWFTWNSFDYLIIYFEVSLNLDYLVEVPYSDFDYFTRVDWVYLNWWCLYYFYHFLNIIWLCRDYLEVNVVIKVWFKVCYDLFNHTLYCIDVQVRVVNNWWCVRVFF